jgi:hypothetical protein
VRPFGATKMLLISCSNLEFPGIRHVPALKNCGVVTLGFWRGFRWNLIIPRLGYSILLPFDDSRRSVLEGTKLEPQRTFPLRSAM